MKVAIRLQSSISVDVSHNAVEIGEVTEHNLSCNLSELFRESAKIFASPIYLAYVESK